MKGCRRAAAAVLLTIYPCASVAAEPASAPDQVAAWIAQAETLLARGDAEAAAASFEQASETVHAPEVEAGVVRSLLQAGRYRQALSFAAHTAGAHLDAPGGAALYAWLLNVGGQEAIARRVLDEALRGTPGEPALLRTRALLTDSSPRPDGTLLDPPWRLAPYAPASLPDGVLVAGTAVLLDDGLSAVVPTATVVGARQLWVRNALGQTVAADIAEGHGNVSQVRLQLASPLPVAAIAVPPLAVPFAGTPAYTVEYVPDVSALDAATSLDSRGGLDGRPAWPLLRSGFLGRTLPADGGRLLGIELKPGPRGGPVFDSRGALIGMSMNAPGGRDRWVSIETGHAEASPNSSASAAAVRPTRAERLSVDALYEVAMRLTLQVLVAK